MQIRRVGKRFEIEYLQKSDGVFFEIEDGVEGNFTDIFIRDIDQLQEISDLLQDAIRKIKDKEEFDE